MKAIARQSTDAERAELDSLLASQPELKAEFERLRGEAHLAKEILPLAAAAESAAEEIPGYARERLQTKVRQTLGRPASAEEKSSWSWRWWLALAPATALVVFLMVNLFNQNEQTVIQVAMLDSAGATRGTDTNLLPVLQEMWKGWRVGKRVGPLVPKQQLLNSSTTGRREKSESQAIGAGCHFKRLFRLAKMLRPLCIRPRRLSLNRRNRQAPNMLRHIERPHLLADDLRVAPFGS